jgi:hypothetical protein
VSLHDELYAKYSAQPHIRGREYDDFLLDEIARLRAELAEAKAEPPRPAAIVYASEGVLHAFEDYDEAVMFSDEHSMDIGGIHQWVWHPKPT